MTRRMLDSGMWSNENFAALPAMARLLQIGMINHADDQGRIKAHPLYLAKEIFPYDRVSPTNIAKWLDLIAGNGTILLYNVEGKQYAQLTKWWEYQSLQYASPSDHPAPPNWKDRIRRTATKMVIVTYNWTLTNGFTVPDTCDERGKPLAPQPAPKPKQPSTSTPPVNTNGHSPDSTPVDSPESSPDDSIYSFNLIEDQPNLIEAEAEGAAPPAAAPGNDVARVWQAWDANMPGTKSPVITEGVNALLEDYSAAEIVEAIAIACRKNKRYLGFVQGVLARGAFSEAPKPSGGDYRPPGNGRMAPVDKTQMEADKLRVMLRAQGKEHILHG